VIKRKRALAFAAALFLGPATLPAQADTPAAPDDLAVFAARLRTFCRACHGVGALRFIRGDDDQVLWRDLFDESAAPGPGGPWAQRIIRVLSWPSDAPPPFNEPLDPPDRDWMPRGAKRLSLASDRVDGQSTRTWLLARLAAGLAR